MGYGCAVRPGFSALRIYMNPLEIQGRLTKGVDSLLCHFEPRARRQRTTNQCLDALDAAYLDAHRAYMLKLKRAVPALTSTG